MTRFEEKGTTVKITKNHSGGYEYLVTVEGETGKLFYFIHI